jgi:hypothetical protein
LSAKSNLLVSETGRISLFMALVFLLLYLANLRTRLYYHAPNWGFLLWIFFYCIVTGIGLLKFRKWAVLLVFLPGILYVAILAYGFNESISIQMPWFLLAPSLLFNYLVAAAVLAIPVNMLRCWRELRW